MTAASQVVCTDTPQGPCRARTGTASRVNPASQHSTTTAQMRPVPSLCPTPVTSAAPPVTSTAATSTTGLGRCRSSSGPTTARISGTQATATPSTAGSAWADPWTNAILKTTNPVRATPSSHPHSTPRGATTRLPSARAKPSSSRQAIVYRTACAVNSGAPDSSEETATLPPTKTMAEAPARIPATARGAGTARGAPGSATGGGPRCVGVAGWDTTVMLAPRVVS